ncbi:hyaluronan-binding protein 2-like [Tachysurus vachellii]|uniref:hyaluronan-binding protein 2-like n=1 Tax=Tachysurus vachellii TaxID=175792 RepID=UPI00296ADD31|nr:hyaluronan-binding protein 2-like [Tachysurus vachellii]
MKLKLLLLLLVFLCTFIIPAQLSKHENHPKHEKEHKKEKPGERHGNKHGKRRGRVEDLLADYDNESSDDEDDEDRGEWLFQLQNVRGTCSPNPCLNNGVCEEKKGRYKCKCPKPFKGRRCEKSKKACKNDTCGYGQCVLTSSPPFYECKCKAPFLPPNCKKIAPCERNPCRNGGTCQKDGQDFDCICLKGFSGKFCQVGPDDCYEGNGESYRGRVSETEDGEDCLFWNYYFLVTKGTNPFTTSDDHYGLGPHNLCRNPDGDSKPWCFIRSGNKIRWDHCNVRKCPTDPTTTASPTLKPTINPILPDSSESQITGSITTGYGTTTLYDTAETPTTAIYAAGSTITGNNATGSLIHIGDDNGEPSPVSEADGSIGSTTPKTHTQEMITQAMTVKPTILPLQTQFTTCGKPQPKSPIHRIYGGIKALPGGQPWQASVQVRAKGSTMHFRHVCGGTLIKPCWVLTAGHCIDNTKDFQVVLGTIDLAKPETSRQTLEVVQTIVHEQYRATPESVYNDIALLRLKAKNGKCAEESQFVKTACLPAVDFHDGTECSISGWGATSESQHGSSQLLDADVLLISQDVCSSIRVYGKDIDNNMFCAGYLEGGVDSCQGDSGGPLTCVENQVHYIYGIVSWGDKCGLKNKPGVYTRVTNFVDWINRKTATAGV